MTGAMNRQNRDIVTAFVISILIHIVFFIFSGRILFGGMALLQESVESAFRVRILPSIEDRYVRRPRADVEAERQRLIRERIREQEMVVPQLSDLPPLSVKADVEGAVSTTYNQAVRDKMLVQDSPLPLPDVMTQVVQADLQMEVLRMGRDVGRESPAVNRQALKDLEGGTPTGLAEAETALSTMASDRDIAPRFAPMPAEMFAGSAAPALRPSLLIPPPPVDLSRAAEELTEVPQLYISPDQERINQFISLDDFLSVELFVYHLPDDPEGYFLVRIRPNERSAELPVMNKDIVFVLDASQSMGTRTMFHLRSAIKICLSRLRDDDWFNVVGFRRQVMKFREGLTPNTPAAIQEALRFVDGLEPSGRTDIYASLEPISKLARGGDHPFIILLLSDGRPTVGLMDSREIINNLTDNLKENSSIFAFGAGSTMNKYLLDLLSYRNKGYVSFSQDFGQIENEVMRMFDSISDPLLINLSADYGNIPTDEIYPRKLPDLFRGGEILIYGRYQGQDRFSLRILGEARGQKKEFVIQIPFPDKDNGPENLPQLWAFRKIYDLIGVMSKEGETPERLAEIQRLSQAYNVRTPYYQ